MHGGHWRVRSRVERFAEPAVLLLLQERPAHGYDLLERMTDNPMVSLNRAIATAMVDGPEAGLALLKTVDEQLADHHRLHAVRAHLLEMAGEVDAALAEYRAAADRTTSVPEQHYLTTRAARLNEGRA